MVAIRLRIGLVYLQHTGQISELSARWNAGYTFGGRGLATRTHSAPHRFEPRSGTLTVRPPGDLGVAIGLKVRPGEDLPGECRLVGASRCELGLGARYRDGDKDDDWPYGTVRIGDPTTRAERVGLERYLLRRTIEPTIRSSQNSPKDPTLSSFEHRPSLHRI